MWREYAPSNVLTRGWESQTSWLCGGATGREHTWSSIVGHSCGLYKEQEKTAERGKRDLYRYMHYHNRYKAHTDSFKLESKLKGTIQGKIAISGEKDSTDEMSEAQREIKQNLFEDQQQQLEANVEKLSKILEEPFETFSDDKVMEIRMQIINLSTIIDKLCQKMYECIENDLLGSLHLGIHSIAPYKMLLSEKDSCIYGASVGVTAQLDRPSGSGSSEDNSGCCYVLSVLKLIVVFGVLRCLVKKWVSDMVLTDDFLSWQTMTTISKML
ncbi:hypothetical protein RJT34_12035 [Clitoria ternatea]|uniref:Ariadne domain-containing protein n=1 Tax=Clitoria ternatea TaxID=43366 RepID=A0AAN9PKK3_CLITE